VSWWRCRPKICIIPCRNCSIEKRGPGGSSCARHQAALCACSAAALPQQPRDCGGNLGLLPRGGRGGAAARASTVDFCLLRGLPLSCAALLCHATAWERQRQGLGRTGLGNRTECTRGIGNVFLLSCGKYGNFYKKQRQILMD
jgi:hypothetical protein